MKLKTSPPPSRRFFIGYLTVAAVAATAVQIWVAR